MSIHLNTGLRRTVIVASTAAAAVLAAASAATAHVTVNPNTAAQGSWTKVSFRVPNEEASANTTAVEVDLPTDTPIASVSVRPVPGWTAQTTTSPLAAPIKTDDGEVTSAVTKIVWTGGSIAPGQFQEFDVSLGPLPTGTQALVFKALQTYSDGSVVRWIDVPAAGQAEPDHPAPVLHLTPKAADGDATGSAGATSGAPTSVPAANVASATSVKESDGAARAIGGAGLAVGVLGLATAVVALRRKNTPAA